MAITSGSTATFDPSNFVDTIDNPLFTLTPGTVFHLRGTTPEGIEHETLSVTNKTRDIVGVTTTVIKDVSRIKGEIVESTLDWYAQDADGNVWYFGEDTATYKNGKLESREGSWEAGVKGAVPGIIINANPQVTDSYRQEFAKGQAEDMYWVVSTNDSLTVPFGHFDHVVHTIEWTPLEPKIVSEKFYAPGAGLISERSLGGPKESIELLDVTKG